MVQSFNLFWDQYNNPNTPLALRRLSILLLLLLRPTQPLQSRKIRLPFRTSAFSSYPFGSVFHFLVFPMSISWKNGFYVSDVHEAGLDRKEGDVPALDALSWKNDFKGRGVVRKEERRNSDKWNSQIHPISLGQNSTCAVQALGWWEKNTASNMTEVKSTDQLVNSLLDAGDKLVIVEFFSHGCGSCRALHPKICQQAELNPSAIFLRVDYDQHRAMCQSLNVQVLPFFQFYRGAEGRVCSFSCTNKTIKKLKDALAKCGSNRPSLGFAKGLEASELESLALNPDEISVTQCDHYLRINAR